MGNNTLTEALKEAYASNTSGEVILYTIEIAHPTFAPIRIVKAQRDYQLTLEATAPANGGEEVTFKEYAFNFNLPLLNEKGIPSIVFSIDNVSLDILHALDAAAHHTVPITLIQRIYLSGNPSAPAATPTEMIVQFIDTDAKTMRLTAVFFDINNRKFPQRTYTADKFPYIL